MALDDPAWPRIDAWLRTHAKLVGRQLRPPASDEQIATAERAIGHPLPASLRDAYRAHDGARGEHPAVFAALRAAEAVQWVRGMAWLPLAGAVQELRVMQRVDPDWPASQLPVAADGGGNLVLIDLVTGAVRLLDHETGELEVLAPDFTTWMTWLADDMEAGLVVTDEDGEALTLLKEAPAPPPPAPVLAPDRAARVLLEVLVERRHIALADGTTGPLIAALFAALATRGKARRLKQILGVLEASDLVDELYASDDMIAVAIEDVG